MFPLFKKKQKIKGTVVLMCKNALDLNDIKAGPSLGAGFGLVRDVVGGVIDGATAILGRSVGLQLISATKTDSNNNTYTYNLSSIYVFSLYAYYIIYIC